MSQSAEIVESELPSSQFAIADEYAQMSATEAKVELQERTKELTAITRANELFTNIGRSTTELAGTFVEELTQWFQYPAVTEAQIAVDETVVESAGFQRHGKPLRKETTTEAGTPIVIEVAYTEDRPAEDDGPWLSEEHCFWRRFSRLFAPTKTNPSDNTRSNGSSNRNSASSDQSPAGFRTTSRR